MSIQYAEGDLYIGSSGGGAITAASGTSGVACGSVLARQVQGDFERALWRFRRGLERDHTVAIHPGWDTVITIEPRDDSKADAFREIIRQLSGGTTGLRSSGGSGDKDGAFARTVQLIVRPVTGALDVCLYSPAVVYDGQLSLLWSREGTHTSQLVAVFRPQRSAVTATTPAVAFDTTANIGTLYF